MRRRLLSGWRERLAEAARTIAETAQATDAALIATQSKLATRVVQAPLPWEAIDTVCGVDVHYVSADTAYAAVVVMDAAGSDTIDLATASGRPERHYAYGLLAYRELPLILAALARLSVRPDVIFYDGNGLVHPRRFGAACHLGLLLDHSVIGVSKNVASYRPFREQCRGDTRLIEAGAGALVVTRAGTKPVCVSPGHRVDLTSAIDLTLRVSMTRIPEPIRRADHAARSICV